MKRQSTTLKHLAQRIAAEIVPDEDGNTYLELNREWTIEASKGLRDETGEELNTLHDRLCRAIPNDFDFSFIFENGGVQATLLLDDGPLARLGMSFPVPLDQHLIDSLREFDWDQLRSKAIPDIQLFDNITDLAAEYPVTLQKTAVIQSRHGSCLEYFRKDTAISNHAYTVLSTDEEADQFEYKVTNFNDRFDLIGQLCDLLACNYAIVAIRASGVLMTPDEVDLIRQEALESLGPISRAKAEGRFTSAFEAMRKNEF